MVNFLGLDLVLDLWDTMAGGPEMNYTETEKLIIEIIYRSQVSHPLNEIFYNPSQDMWETECEPCIRMELKLSSAVTWYWDSAL